MSENWEYCCMCGEACRRIGLDDEPCEYAYCPEGYGCQKHSQKTSKENKDEL